MSRSETRIQNQKPEMENDQVLTSQELEMINAGMLIKSLDAATPKLTSQTTIIGGFKSMSGMS